MKIPKLIFRSPRYFISGNNNLYNFNITIYSKKFLNNQIYNTIDRHIAGTLNGFFRSRIVLNKFQDSEKVLKVLKNSSI